MEKLDLSSVSPFKEMQEEHSVLLASTSPRRKQLLEDYLVLPGNSLLIQGSRFNEDLQKGEFDNAESYVLETAKGKGSDVVNQILSSENQALQSRIQSCTRNGLIVISADTIVAVPNFNAASTPASSLLKISKMLTKNNTLILEKPADKGEAKAILSILSSRQHVVYTAVCLYVLKRPNDNFKWELVRSSSFVEGTKVNFADLSDAMIDAYLLGDEAMDKAGAYAYQGASSFFVRGIEGCFYNVVGLPLHRLLWELKELFQ